MATRCVQGLVVKWVTVDFEAETSAAIPQQVIAQERLLMLMGAASANQRKPTAGRIRPWQSLYEAMLHLWLKIWVGLSFFFRFRWLIEQRMRVSDIYRGFKSAVQPQVYNVSFRILLKLDHTKHGWCKQHKSVGNLREDFFQQHAKLRYKKWASLVSASNEVH